VRLTDKGVVVTREHIIDKVVNNLDSKFNLTTREFNLIRNSVIDTCISFESRTCESCKYWVQSPNKALRWCVGFKNQGITSEHITGDKFYCANWESK
jgi:hypothetical protein